MQQQERDCDVAYSSVLWSETSRLIMAIAAAKEWHVCLLDVTQGAIDFTGEDEVTNIGRNISLSSNGFETADQG
jgi:hypothetical protein